MPALVKRNIIARIVFGYLLALSLTVAIVFLAFTGLNRINETVGEMTTRLTVTRALSLDIINKFQSVQFYADRYQRQYHQKDLDQFNAAVVALTASQKKISALMDHQATLEVVRHIQQETREYVSGFEEIAKLIMYQQSLLSTTSLKQELLVENHLSAIRINVGVVQVPDIYFSFGNARNAFELMRLNQSKYLSEHDEKYFVMFKSNYANAWDAFSNLVQALTVASKEAAVVQNAQKAMAELKVYYETFIDIHAASLSFKKLSRNLISHERAVFQAASNIAFEIEEQYKKNNRITQDLVASTQFQLIAAVIAAVLLNLVLIFIVLRKIIRPILQELQQLSSMDSLTNLANRRAFDACLDKESKCAKREAQPLSLILCDVDFFKNYNDEYGHQQGDECLQKIAATISKGCSRPGDFVARYGGEEFIIILPNTSTEGAVHAAEMIKSRVEGLQIPHRASSIGSVVTISMGVATMPPGHPCSSDALIKNSDRALYKAKENSRNCVAVYSDGEGKRSVD